MRNTGFAVPSRWVLAGLLLAAVAGCGRKDARPKYVAPSLSASEAATLKANNDYWIEEIDGAVTKRPGMKVVVQPGNTVKVTPGEHRVVVSKSGTDYLVQQGGGSNFWRFSYNFRAGHTYKLGGAGVGKGIKITDTNTGTETVVGG
jgi:hypothetical protein